MWFNVLFRVKQLFKNTTQRSTPAAGAVATPALVAGTVATPTMTAA